MIKYKYISILILLHFTKIYSQSQYGIKGGINNSRFYGFFKNQNYQTKSNAFSKYTFSVFYSEKITTKQLLGFELESKSAKPTFEINTHQGKSYFYEYANYSLNYLTLYLTYQNIFLTKNKISLSGNLTSYLGYLVDSKAHSFEKKTQYTLTTDTAGNVINILTLKIFEKNENPAKDLKKVLVGIRPGLTLQIKLNNKIEVFMETTYCIGINNILKTQDVRYTSFSGINFTIGLLFKDNHDYIKLQRIIN